MAKKLIHAFTCDFCGVACRRDSGFTPPKWAHFKIEEKDFDVCDWCIPKLKEIFERIEIDEKEKP